MRQVERSVPAEARSAAVRPTVVGSQRWWDGLRRLIDRLLAVGVVASDPAVQRRQRFVNIAAFVGGLASFFHVTEQLVIAPAALQPLIVHNALFGLAHLSTPLFHRAGRNAAALWLCLVIIVGTIRVIWLTGLEGGAQVYFAFTAAAFLFFGVQHWRLFALVVALAFGTVVTAYLFAPELGPVGRAAPDYVHHLAAMVVVNVMAINVWLFTYALVKTHRAETALASEVARADTLLLAILPRAIAARLKKAPGAVVADRHECATVFFADLVGFTTAARNAEPEALVAWLDTLFRRLDDQAVSHKVEKIKTIGDAYMAASGLRITAAEGADRIARFALAFRDTVEDCGGLGGAAVKVRIGIHSGPVVAGVIGGTRFAYDMWGDAVNVASRMESHGDPGRIQVSAATAALLGSDFVLEHRGAVAVKGIGAMEAYWLERATAPSAEPSLERARLL
jgi:class 3 adenylate cyclase